MSVDEYQKFGRSEMLRYATPGEIIGGIRYWPANELPRWQPCVLA